MQQSIVTKGLAFAGALTLLGSLGACKNSGEPTAVIPNPSPGDTGPAGDRGVGIDFTPFENLRTEESMLVDLGFEGDGDVVAFDGAWSLYTPGGVFKRSLNGAPAVAIAGSGLCGKGMQFIDPSGNIAEVVDDAFETSGCGGGIVNGAWFGGEPDPFQTGCSLSITAQWMGPFGNQPPTGQGRTSPAGFDYNPFDGQPFWKVTAQQLIVDNNSDGGPPCNRVIPRLPLQPPWGVILSYNPGAPGLDGWWNGPDLSDLAPPGDFVMYAQKGQCDGLALLPDFAEWAGSCKAIAWDRLYPTPLTSGESSRAGMSVSNIGDFVFDADGRILMTVPASNSWAMSEPISTGDHIVIQRIIGGRQDGDGTTPVDLQGPSGIAIDRFSREILVADTGHDRVVIFDSEGEFLRQFATPAAPRAIAVDAFRRIFISTDDGLIIRDQFGATPVFGSIEGIVKDSRTQAPIARASVKVAYPTAYGTPNPDPQDPEPNPFLSQQTETDDNGFFLFGQIVLADQLNLITTRAGFLDATVSVDVTPSQTTKVEIIMVPENTSSPGFGSVRGILISDSNGEPLANFNVGVKGSGISDRSNGFGEFLILGIPAGVVEIEVTANGTKVYTQPNVVVADGQTKDIGTIRLPGF